jgi:transcriptional regulator with XRE-family HTH domain
MATTRNFADVIRAQLAADPELAKGVEVESFNANVAQQVYDARIAAGLTQTQLAERCGTQQSVISRIEDADYYGHSLSLLKRIAEALDCKLRVEFFKEAPSSRAKRARKLARKPVKSRV